MDKYLVHAVEVPAKTGGMLFKYYIRERGAPIGEWVCRVYDAAQAQFICDAMNAHDWLLRTKREMQRYAGQPAQLEAPQKDLF
jgi:hypothetical protein